MTHDADAAATRSPRTMRLNSSLHLQDGRDGGALVVDDRTFSVAHVNKAARVLLEALLEPHTQEELVTVLAQAADCDADDAATPVAELVDELTKLDWIKIQSETISHISAAPGG